MTPWQNMRTSPLKVNSTLTRVAFDDVPTARVRRSTSQSLTNNTNTAISFDQERWDTNGLWDLTPNPTRATCRTPGVYVFEGCVRFASNATGVRGVSVRLNGATNLAQNTLTAVNGATHPMVVSTLYTLAVGDYVELMAIQTSGGALNVDSVANFTPEFSVCWLGNFSA